MHLESEQARARGLETQQARIDARLQIETNRAHIADNLCRRLFEREIQAVLAARTSGLDEVCREAGFSGSGCPRYENAGAGIKATGAQHLVQAQDPG